MEDTIRKDIDLLRQMVERQNQAISDIRQSLMTLSSHIVQQEMDGTRKRAPRKRHDLDSDDVLYGRLCEIITEKKLYKQDFVPSWEIAASLNISQKRLKEVLAHSPWRNMNRLMNHHRIMAACQMMQQFPTYTIEAISEESGFRSMKSFYRWFQKEMGITPTEFKNDRVFFAKKP